VKNARWEEKSSAGVLLFLVRVSFQSPSEYLNYVVTRIDSLRRITYTGRIFNLLAFAFA